MNIFRSYAHPGWFLLPILLALTLIVPSWADPARARETAAASALPAAGNISVQDAAALLNKAPAGLIILDVRTPQEFREGHLAGARNVDFFGGRFEMETADLPRDATLLIYCRSGKRSAAAAETLGEAGMDRILHMYQGIEGWKDAGLPLVK